MNTAKTVLFAGLALVASVANAGFNDYEYQASFPGKFAFGVAVIDSRDFVATSPDKANLLGGEVSGFFGRRRELLTESNKPVADEISDGLRSSLIGKQGRAVAMVTPRPGTSLQQFSAEVKDFELSRTLVLDVQNIWVDMSNAKNTEVAYQIELSVLDQTGKILAKVNDNKLMHSNEWGTYASDEIVGLGISNLLSRPEIVKAMEH